MALIKVSELTKTYSHSKRETGLAGAIRHFVAPQYYEKTAVNNIDFEIGEGEAVAYVGPNGAGKSTTIKMLTGILKPTSGTILVNGIDPFRNRIENAKRIGTVFGQRTQLWWDLPITESFLLLKDIYDISPDIYKQNYEKFCELLGLRDFIHLTGRKLSLGQRMRADLAAALLHNPRILYLDEPTIGLDVAVKENIRQFIREINREQGTTIVLTTHDLKDIEEICSRLIVIDDGRKVHDASIDSFKNAFGQERQIHIHVKQPVDQIVPFISSIPNTELSYTETTRFGLIFNRYHINPGEIIARVIKFAEIVDFQLDEPDIEQVFRKMYSGDLDLSSFA